MQRTNFTVRHVYVTIKYHLMCKYNTVFEVLPIFSSFVAQSSIKGYPMSQMQQITKLLSNLKQFCWLTLF